MICYNPCFWHWLGDFQDLGPINTILGVLCFGLPVGVVARSGRLEGMAWYLEVDLDGKPRFGGLTLASGGGGIPKTWFLANGVGKGSQTHCAAGALS